MVSSVFLAILLSREKWQKRFIYIKLHVRVREGCRWDPLRTWKASCCGVRGGHTRAVLRTCHFSRGEENVPHELKPLYWEWRVAFHKQRGSRCRLMSARGERGIASSQTTRPRVVARRWVGPESSLSSHLRPTHRWRCVQSRSPCEATASRRVHLRTSIEVVSETSIPTDQKLRKQCGATPKAMRKIKRLRHGGGRAFLKGCARFKPKILGSLFQTLFQILAKFPSTLFEKRARDRSPLTPHRPPARTGPDETPSPAQPFTRTLHALLRSVTPVLSTARTGRSAELHRRARWWPALDGERWRLARRRWETGRRATRPC